MHANAKLDLEFPERFQAHVSQTFPGSILLLNSFTRYYAAVGHSLGSAFVEPCRVKKFCDDLLDFESEVKKPLRQCFEMGTAQVRFQTAPP